jgi:hypothetical protein
VIKYSIFKDEIKPMWEDAANKKTGRWVIKLQKQQINIELDQFRLETIQGSRRTSQNIVYIVEI